MGNKMENYLEKVYAGWLGKMIGIRSGANIEMWTYNHIKTAFGEIDGYPHDFKTFAADDDSNGPMFFVRALEDFTCSEELTSEQIGKTWLNYVPDSRRFFWWSGYGVSTEHTAYLNLKNGIPAPRSGSAELNGTTISEQIGGQIFIDSWGLVSPGNPEMAARFAQKAASVSHDGNGVYGGMFIAAAIAAAFTEQNIEKIILTALKQIPDDCNYSKTVRDVMSRHKEIPEWRDCYKYVEETYFSREINPGNCHIIPNTAIIILALLYGNGNFTDTINICNMCGFDTDCNTANVGTIMGVRGGLEGIEKRWREPINDFMCASSAVGSLNLLDVPECAAYLARFGYRLAGEEYQEEYKSVLSGTAPKYHFMLPGSTHVFKAESEAGYASTVQNVEEMQAGKRCLKVSSDWAEPGTQYRAYVKTDYVPEDFSDSRYDPCFSPILYPGQTIKAKIMVPENLGIEMIQAHCFVKDQDGNIHRGETKKLILGQYETISYKIAHMENLTIAEAGVEWIPITMNKGEELGFAAYIDWMDFGGTASYAQELKCAKADTWNTLHINVHGFSYLRGHWRMENGAMIGSYAMEPAETYTGNHKWKDLEVTTVLEPHSGNYHNVNFRVQGAMRSYAAGFGPDKKIVLYKNDYGYQILSEEDFPWEFGKSYTIKISLCQNEIKVFVDGKEYISCTDENHPYLNGCIGFSNWGGAVTAYHRFAVEEHQQ